MRLFSTVLVSACLFAMPVVATAQGEGDEVEEVEGDGAEATEAEGEADGEATEAKAADPASSAATDAAYERFDIRHGFFSEGDLGIFLSFGGTNTNNPALPGRGTSNVQPYFGMVFGYDVTHSEKFNLGVGFKLGMLLNGGAGRVSSDELPGGGAGIDATSKPNDFNIIEAGASIEASIFVTPRFAITVKGDGGLAMLDPDPSKAAASGPDASDALDGAGGIGIGGIFGVGAGVEYFTLLNGFSVGLTLRFVGILADGFIPGAAVSIPVKYNF